MLSPLCVCVYIQSVFSNTVFRNKLMVAWFVGENLDNRFKECVQ